MDLSAGTTDGRSAMSAEPGAVVPGTQLRVLTMTTLFPSAVNPRLGIFVETRLRKLCSLSRVDLRVVAPVPWFPLYGRYAAYATTPARNLRNGIRVWHPRFLSIPRIGMALQPTSLARATLRAFGEIQRDGWSCDVIDAHYLYPDGVAAALVARQLNRPFVVTARGSDVNLIAQMPAPRRRILAALLQAGRVIAVSGALKAALIRLGVPGERIEVLRNGVDLALFSPAAHESIKARLGVGQASLIASVGNLVVEKGHDLVLRAASSISGTHVVVVGEGPERARLGALAAELGMQERVHFVGNVPQAELASIYSAADVLALGSVREGWPNVLLEAMACGTPVVATAVGGVPEVVTSAVAGEVVQERSEAQFASALQRVLARSPEREAVRAYAAGFSWEPVVRRYYDVLTSVARLPGPITPELDVATDGTRHKAPI